MIVIGFCFVSLHWQQKPDRIFLLKQFDLVSMRVAASSNHTGQFEAHTPTIVFCFSAPNTNCWLNAISWLLSFLNIDAVDEIPFRLPFRNEMPKGIQILRFRIRNSPFTHRLADDGYIGNLYGYFVGFWRNVSENRMYAGLRAANKTIFRFTFSRR